MDTAVSRFYNLWDVEKENINFDVKNEGVVIFILDNGSICKRSTMNRTRPESKFNSFTA